VVITAEDWKHIIEQVVSIDTNSVNRKRSSMVFSRGYMGQAVTFPNRPKAVGVLVSDGSALNRQLITLALQRDRSLQVADAGNESVLEAAKRLRPDVVILSDHQNAYRDSGFEILRKLWEFAPESRIIVLLDDEDRQQVVSSFRLGARGVFCRCQPVKMLARCVHKVHEGQSWVSACQMDYVLEALSHAPVASVVDARGEEMLSPREQEVVRWMADGLSNREIANEMRLSENTVKNYVYRIFNKLGVSNRVEVVMYAASQRPNVTPRRTPSSPKIPLSALAAAATDCRAPSGVALNVAERHCGLFLHDVGSHSLKQPSNRDAKRHRR
jgi:two-component system, NarL family, response regulator DegU